MLNITKTTINLGLEKPVKILQVTDIHLTYANEQDTEFHQDFMKVRYETFYNEGGKPPYNPKEYFEMAIKYANDNDCLLVNTGDCYDILTKGNVETYKQITKGVDMMFTPGGHEHQWQCVRVMEEPYPYIEETRPKVQEIFKEHNLDLTSRVVNGVNIVCMDNSLDYYSPKTLELFKKELEKGLPVIVFSHDPIWDKMLEHTAPYHPNVRLTEKDYKASHETIDILLKNPLVIATFSGHNHVDMEREIEGKLHYSTAGLFKGKARLIEII